MILAPPLVVSKESNFCAQLYENVKMSFEPLDMPPLRRFRDFKHEEQKAGEGRKKYSNAHVFFF